jgi:C4-dicarboxylate-specific signal transduction histidine kinase
MGREAAQIVNALLDGTSPVALRLPEATLTALHVDWRQVERWGIDEKQIPRETIISFREPTFWEEYRHVALVASALILLQAALITTLLVERRRRRKAESSVQKQRSELAHASRLAIVGELTGSIAHEINQPLGAILSNADAADLILESATDRRGEVRQILADIRRDDLRASEVIHRLRTLLAKHEVDRKPFDLNDVVRDVAALLSAEARHRRVTLDTQFATAAATVTGDPIQMQQVLINLVLNAMDAMAAMPEALRTVTIAIGTTADGYALTVRDRGQGIAADHLPKLFESFFSTKNKGMGLGLSIARTIVEAHGGRIRAESLPGRGAVFHVELPAARAPRAVEAVSGQPSPVRA